MIVRNKEWHKNDSYSLVIHRNNVKCCKISIPRAITKKKEKKEKIKKNLKFKCSTKNHQR